MFLILAGISAYNRCWFLGDEFMGNSYEQYFKMKPGSANEYSGYIHTHFDASGFYNSFTSDNPSVIGRLANLMCQAIYGKNLVISSGSSCPSGTSKKLLPLPKIIVIVLDDDIICALAHVELDGLSKPIARVLNYIMTEHERMITAFKEYLPSKSIRNDHPQILWIQSPLHDNFTNNGDRYKFNKCLEESVKFHSNVHTLMLKKVWDSKNSELFQLNRYTSFDLQSYWEAIDRTVRYFDSILLKKLLKTDVKMKQNKPGNTQNRVQSGQNDCFCWKKPASEFEDGRFAKLPEPPLRRFSNCR